MQYSKDIQNFKNFNNTCKRNLDGAIGYNYLNWLQFFDNNFKVHYINIKF